MGSKQDQFAIVGRKYSRPDGFGKATGTVKYCADLQIKGMLYGAVHLSEEPSAKILSIDTSKAIKSPGVVRVFTSKDIPGEKAVGNELHSIQVLADTEVKYQGSVIAFVVADTEKHAQEAAKRITVQYDPTPPITDPVKAMLHDSPKMTPEGNVGVKFHTSRGDIEKGFSEADVILEKEYRTQVIEHLYMETECAVAVYQGHEMLIYGCFQYPYVSQEKVARTLGLDLAHVIIRQTPMGGGFGGKSESMDVVASLVGLAAYYLDRPVMLRLTSEDSMRISSKRHPYVLRYKAGVKKDGTFTALKAEIIADTGPLKMPFVLFRSHALAPGPYNWKNWQIDSYQVLTNNCLSASMRGFGNPQVVFATESIIDELANEIHMDPIRLRLKNAFIEGSLTHTGQRLDNMPVNFKKVLERVREISDWDKKRKEYSKDTGRYRRGIG
ncbi:MAG: xanthine dehydrogenase family protein molybdopterin-binding subunit, partial [Candidatus Ranarchaeia archaeon]